jgi:hypothetical protein
MSTGSLGPRESRGIFANQPGLVITAASSLRDVVATISRALSLRGISIVVVGASAITAHSHRVHTPQTIEFAVPSGMQPDAIDETLATLGFTKNGSTYSCSASPFDLAFVSETPRIRNRTVTEYETIETSSGPFQALRIEDAVAERIAAYLFAHDSHSLHLAEKTLDLLNVQIDRWILKKIVDSFDVHGDRAAERRLTYLRERLWLGKPQAHT